MKKTLISIAAVTAILSLGACSGNQKAAVDHSGDKTEVFTGVLPGADVDGIRYTLKLDYDDDHNFTDGDYDLLETYLKGDSLSAMGYKDVKSFTSEGDFTVENGTGDNSGKKYIKLVKDQRDSAPGSVESPLYFLVDSDSTITMVNADLQLSADSALNYTLKLVK